MMSKNLLNETALRLTLGAFVFTQVSQPLMAQSATSQSPIVVGGGNASMDVSVNGTPIVVIEAPDEEGTSHNIFSRFDVNSEGVIINNSMDVAESVLGGFVLGNPNLINAGREADLVIAEVLNGNRSTLAGALEMLGTNAAFILANEAGITCNGCGFINMPNVTLSTGKVQFGADGKYSGLLVNSGNVRVEGAGLLGGNVDYFDIVSLTTEINANLYAKDLLISAGAAEYDTRTRSASSLGHSGSGIAVDTSLLGGMYANRIRLVGNDLGMGVNLRGDVASLEGDIEIDVGGDITSGRLQSEQDLSLTSRGGNINIGDNSYAGGNASLDAAGDVAIEDGFLGAAGNVEVEAGGAISAENGAIYAGLDIEGGLTGDGALTLAAGQGVSLQSAQVLAAGHVDIDALDVTADSASVVGGNSLAVAASNNIVSQGLFSSTNGLTINSGRLVALNDVQSGGDLNITAENIELSGEVVGMTSAALTAQNQLQLGEEAALLTNGAATISAASLDNAGGILGVESIIANISGDLNNSGSLATGGALSLDIGGNLTSAGNISAQSAITIAAVNSTIGGTIVSDEAISLITGDLDLTGTISAGDALDIDTSGALLTGADSQLFAEGELTLDSVGDVILGGQVFAGGALDVDSEQDLTISGVTQAVGSVSANAEAIEVSGELVANEAVTINSAHGITLSGSIGSGGAVALEAGGAIDAAQSQQLLAGGDLTLASGGDISLGGVSSSGGQADIEAAENLTLSGEISASDGLSLTAQGELSQQDGLLESGGDLSLAASDISLDGDLLSLQDLAITSDQLGIGSEANIQAVGDISVDVAGALVSEGNFLSKSSIALISGGDATLGGSIQAGADLDVSAQNIAVTGDLLALGDLELLTAGDIAVEGSLASAGSVNLSADNIVFATGSYAQSEGDLTASFANLTQDGDWLSGGSIFVEGDNLETAGTFSAISDIALDLAQSINLAEGSALGANGNISASSASFNTAGVISASGNVDIDAAGELNIADTGAVLSNGAQNLSSGTAIDNQGVISANGALSLEAADSISSSGQIASGSTATLAANTIDIGGTLNALGDIDLNGSESVDLTAQIGTDGALIIDTKALTSGEASDVTAGQAIHLTADDITLDGNWVSGGVFDVMGDNLSITGSLGAVGNMRLIAASLLDHQGELITEGNLQLTAPVLNLDGSVFAASDLSIESGALTIGSDAAIRTAALLELSSQNALELDGFWAGGSGVNISSASSISVIGRLESGGETQLEAADGLDISGSLLSVSDATLSGANINVTGTIESAGNAALASELGTIDLSGVVIANGDVALLANQIDVSGGISSGAELTVNAGQVDIDQAGQLIGNKVNINSVGSITNAGLVFAEDELTLEAGASLINTGSLEGRGTASLKGDIINLGGAINFESTVVIAALSRIDLIGQLASNGGLSLTGPTIQSHAGSALAAYGDVGLAASEQLNLAGEHFASGRLVLTAPDMDLSGVLVSDGDLSVTADNSLLVDGTLYSASNLTVQAQDITLGGILAADGDISLASDYLSALAASTIQSSANINVATTEEQLHSGLISALGKLELASGTGLSLGGQIETQGDIGLNAGGLISGDGTLLTASNIGITAENFNWEGLIEAQGEANLDLEEGLNLSGNIFTKGAINIDTDTAIVDGLLVSDDAVKLDVQSLDLEGAISAGVALDLDIVNDLHTSEQARIFSGGSANIDALSFTHQGQLSAADDLTLTLGDALDSSGLIESGGDVSLTADGDVDLSGQLFALGDLNMKAADITISGSIGTNEGLEIAADTLFLDGAITALAASAITLTESLSTSAESEILSGSSLQITAGEDIAIGGIAFAEQDIVLDAGEALLLDGVVQSNGTARLLADRANFTGMISTGGDVEIEAGSVEGSGTLISEGALSIDAVSASFTSTSVISSEEGLDIQLSGDFSQAGYLGSNGDLSATFDNGQLGGTIFTGGDLSLDAVTSLTQDGNWTALGAIALTSGGNASFAGNLFAGETLDISAERLSALGNSELIALEAISLAGAELLTLSGAIGTNDTLQITGGQEVNLSGSLAAGDLITLTAGTTLTSIANITGDGGIELTAGTAAIGGTLSSGQSITLTSNNGAMTLSADVLSGDDISIDSAGLLDVSGLIQSEGALSLAAESAKVSGQIIGFEGLNATIAQTINIGATGQLASLDDTSLVAGALENLGVIESLGELEIKTNNDMTNAGLILASEQLAINSEGAFSNTGSIAGEGLVTLSSTGNVTQSGLLRASGALEITGLANAALDGTTYGESGLSLDIDGDITAGGDSLIITPGALDIAAGGAISLAGLLDIGGALSIEAGDALNIAGDIQAVSAITLDAANIALTGRAFSDDLITMRALEGLTLVGTVSAGGGIILSGSAITLGADAAALTNGNISAVADQFTNQGLMSATGEVDINADVTNLSGRIEAGGPVKLVAETSLTQSGEIESGTSLTATGGDLTFNGAVLSLGALSLDADGKLQFGDSAALGSVGAISLSGQNVVLGGTIEGQGDVDIAALLDITGATDIVSDGSISLVAGNENAAKGKLFATNDISISGKTIDSDMAATALGTLKITSTGGDMDLAGAFQSVRAVTLNSAGAITYAATSNFADENVIYSQATTSLNAGGGVSNAGTIAADGNLSVTTPGLLTNSGTLSGESLLFDVDDLLSTGTLISQQDFNLTADSLSISGGLVSGGDINLRALTDDLSVDADLSATNLSLISDNGGISISSDSVLTSSKGINLTAVDNILISGILSAGELLSITSSAGDMNIASTGDIRSGGTATIIAEGLISNAGFLASDGLLLLEADEIETANIVSNSNVTLRATNDISITGKIESLAKINATSQLGSVSINDQGGLIATDEVNVGAAAGKTITSTGVIVAGYSEDADGVASYDGDISLEAGTLALGGFVGGNEVDLNDSGTLNLKGTLLARGGLSIAVNSLLIGEDGYLFSSDGLNLNLSQFNNQGNLISDAGIAFSGSGNWSNAGNIAGTSLSLITSGNLASTGNLYSAGDLDLSAAILSLGGNTTTLGDLDIDAASVVILGQAASAGAITIDSLGAFTVGTDGVVDAETSLTIIAGDSGTIDGTLVSDGAITLDLEGALTIGGRILSFDDSGMANSIVLDAESISLAGLVQSDSGAALKSNQGDIDIAGQLSVGGALSLNAGSSDISITDAGLIYAGKALDLIGHNITNDGAISAVEALTITSDNGLVRNRGQIFSYADIALNAGSGSLDLGGAVTGDNVDLNAATFAISGDLFASKDLTLTGLSGVASTLDVTGQITAVENLTIDLSGSSSNTINLNGDADSDYTLYAGKVLDIDTVGAVTVDALLIGVGAVNIASDGNLSLAGSTESSGDIDLEFAAGNITGNVISGGSIALSGSSLNLSGALQGSQGVTGAITGDLELAEDGLILSEQDVTLYIGQLFTSNGSISAGGDATISADSFTIGSTGFIIANNDLDLISRSASQTSAINGQLSAQNSLSVIGNSAIDIAGQIFSDNSATIDAVGTIRLTNDQALVFANDLLKLATEGGSLDIAGTLQSSDQINLDTGSGSGTITVSDTGVIQSVGNARMIALDSTEGSGANIAITSQNQITNNGTIATDGSVFIASDQAGISLGADSALTAGTEAILRAENSGVDLTAALAGGNIHATSLAIYQQDAFSNSGTYSSPYNLLISASSIENSGLLGAEGNLSLITSGGITNTGTIYSGYNLKLDSDGDLLNDEGLILALGNIDIDAANVTNLSGSIESLAGSVDITTGNLTNKIKTLVITTDNGDGSDPAYRLDTVTENSGAARIVATGDIGISSSGTVLNDDGTMLAGGNIVINADILNNIATELLYTRTSYPSGLIEICLVANQIGNGGGCAEPEYLTPQEAVARGIYVPTTVKTTTSTVGGVIQAGGLLSITANQLGNGTYVDASGEIIPQSGAPTIADANAVTPLAPGKVDTATVSVAVPASTVGIGGSAGSATDGTVTRGTQQYSEERVPLIGFEAGGVQTLPTEVDLGGYAAESIGSSVSGPVTSTIDGASDVLLTSNDPANISVNISSDTDFVNAGAVSASQSDLLSPTGPQDQQVGNVQFLEGSLPANVGGVDGAITHPKVIPTTKVVIAEEVALPDSIEIEGGAGNSDDLNGAIDGTTIDTGLSVGDVSDTIGSGEGTGDLSDTGDVTDTLGSQFSPDDIDPDAGLLMAFAISSIADFDQLQSGFLFGFLDRFGLAPQENGLGFSGDNTLFSFNNVPGAEFLFTTNPGFGSTAGLFDSNYFFDQLGVDRDTSFTRLGDGFFESQFIAEQVRAATNQAQLPQYGSPLDQAQSLMQSAVDQQESLGLEMGVELTDDQLAALNTSIVWWVTGEVAGTEVLIPVVYLAAADQKVIENGAVLAGNNVVANIAGSLENTGSIAANNIASLSATNITNKDGGSIAGGAVIASATQDIINRNAQINGGDVQLTAQRDVLMDPVLSQSVSSDNSNWRGGSRYENSTTRTTQIDGVSQIGATNNLTIAAGRDVKVTAGSVTAGGDAILVAGRDVEIGGVETSTSVQERWQTSKRTYGTSSNSITQFNGSDVTAGGNLTVQAGENLAITGSNLAAGGNVSLTGEEGISIQSGLTSTDEKLNERLGKRNWETRDIQTTTNVLSDIRSGGDFTAATGGEFSLEGGNVDAGGLASINAQNIEILGVKDSEVGSTSTREKSRGLLSSTVTKTDSQFDLETVVQSNFGGAETKLISQQDINIAAANVVADGAVSLVAGGDVTIGAMAAQNTQFENVNYKKSGISLGGGGLFIGVAKQRSETDTDSIYHVGSMVGSAEGDVSISAGGTLAVEGSQIVTPGDIALAARNIEIIHNLDVVDTDTRTKSSSFGLSIGVNEPAINSATSAIASSKLAANSSVARTRAVAGVAAAVEGYRAFNGAQELNKSIQTNGAVVTVSLGFNSSRSENQTHDETVIGSLVSGGDVTLTAAGAGADSTINITGSDIEASGDLALGAEGAINILSATENDTQSGSSSSVGISLSATMNAGFTKKGGIATSTPNYKLSFNSSSSEHAQNDITHIESTLSAGELLSITTPDALTIAGGIVTGDRVEVDVGSLDISSLQDTSTYESSNKSMGLNASFTLGGAPTVGGSVGKGSQNGDFASVTEQSGIFAGEGGFDIKVEGATELTGAVIASEAEAALNRLETGSLAMSDIENREEWEASKSNFSFSTDEINPAQLAQTAISAGSPSAMGGSGSQEGTSFSAIGAGTIIVGGEDRSDDSSLNRDTDGANDGALEQEFTEEKRQEIADAFAAAQMLAGATGNLLDDLVKVADEKERQAEEDELNALKADKLAAQAEENGDSLLASAMRKRAVELRQSAERLYKESETWAPGSTYRQVLNGLVAAASGDVTGSLNSLIKNFAVSTLQQWSTEKIVGENKHNLTDEERILLHALIGCAGGTAGASGSCAAGVTGQGGAAILTTIVHPPKDATAQEKEAYSKLIQSLIATIASAAGVEGSELATVIASAQAEVENNRNHADPRGKSVNLVISNGKSLTELLEGTPGEKKYAEDFINGFPGETFDEKKAAANAWIVYKVQQDFLEAGFKILKVGAYGVYGFGEGAFGGLKDLVVDISTLARELAIYQLDMNIAVGGFGDFLRDKNGKPLPPWLEEVLPSFERGLITTSEIVKLGNTIGEYAKTRAQDPDLLLSDVTDYVLRNWDSLKISHSEAAAKGPEEEARWWGNIAGRAVFEVASLFIPITKIGAAARAARAARAASSGRAAKPGAVKGRSDGPSSKDGDGQGGAAGSAGKVCSFHGDTLVLTDGGLTPIRDVTTSMSVWSRNPATGAMAMKPVQARTSNPYEETISVSIRKVGNDNAKASAVQTIVSNRIHPYFVQTTRRATNSEGHDYQGPIANGKWVDAGDLLAGDRLLNNDATWSQVVSVKAEDKPLTAYNLTVSDFHTYFVSGSNASNLDAASVWVHNDCFPDKKEMARRLGVTENVFHRDIKPDIVDDFNHGLQRKGIRNPDIGVDDAGNIIFRDSVSKRVVLRTDVPLSTYAE